MRRQLAVGLVLSLVLTALAPSVAGAQPPDLLTRYNLIPRKSTLIESGGFTGWTTRYKVRGKFDFLELWTPGVPGSPYQQIAQFDNADVRAPLGEMLPAFLDVDEIFNLEGLTGKPLPLGAPFDVYHFQGRGNTSDAASPLEQSSVDLYAALLGPWMYLYGETTPPPGSADYPVYQIKALARTGYWADLNQDGVVDAADYTLHRDPQSDPRAFTADWDWVHEQWRSQYGEREPDMDAMDAALSAALATSFAVAVPEPGCLVLLAVGLVLPVARRRRAI